MGFTSSNMSNWNLSSRANDNVGQEPYDAIRSDSNDENWAFFAYDYKSKKEVAVSGSGSGDISEFFSHVKDQRGGFGFAVLKLVMKKVEEQNSSFLLGYQKKEQTNSQSCLKET